MFFCFRFLYTGELNITGISIVKVIAVAEKYRVINLVKLLVAQQLQDMNAEEFCPFVRKNETHMNDLIKFKCLEYVFARPSAVFQSASFQVLPFSFLKEVLAHSRLVLDEETVCTATLLWASKQCEMKWMKVNGKNQRIVLEDAIFNIRIPLLSQDYFTENISEKGLLTDSEEVHILKYFLNPKKPFDGKFIAKKRVAPGSRFMYSPTRETATDSSLAGLAAGPDLPIEHPLSAGKHGCIQRFKEHREGWGYRGVKKDAIIIVVSRDIRMEYIYIYGACRFDRTMDVSFVIQDDKADEISSTEATIPCIVSKPTYELGVKNETGSYGVRLNADVEYHLILTIKGDNSYYGKDGKANCSGDGLDVEFKNSKFSSNNTSVEIGQIESFKFTYV